MKKSELASVSSLAESEESVESNTTASPPLSPHPPTLGTSRGSSAAIFDLRHPARVTRDTSLPWLARISRQSPSLALTRLAWGCRGPTGRGDAEGGRRGMPPSSNDLPFARTHTRALARAHECSYERARCTYTILRP